MLLIHCRFVPVTGAYLGAPLRSSNSAGFSLTNTAGSAPLAVAAAAPPGPRSSCRRREELLKLAGKLADLAPRALAVRLAVNQPLSTRK